MITCPVCGYTFRNTFKKENLGPEKTKIICPMCNFKFKDPNIPPEGLDEFFFWFNNDKKVKEIPYLVVLTFSKKIFLNIQK